MELEALIESQRVLIEANDRLIEQQDVRLLAKSDLLSTRIKQLNTCMHILDKCDADLRYLAAIPTGVPERPNSAPHMPLHVWQGLVMPRLNLLDRVSLSVALGAPHARPSPADWDAWQRRFKEEKVAVLLKGIRKGLVQVLCPRVKQFLATFAEDDPHIIDIRDALPGQLDGIRHCEIVVFAPTLQDKMCTQTFSLDDIPALLACTTFSAAVHLARMPVDMFQQLYCHEAVHPLIASVVADTSRQQVFCESVVMFENTCLLNHLREQHVRYGLPAPALQEGITGDPGAMSRLCELKNVRAFVYQNFTVPRDVTLTMYHRAISELDTQAAGFYERKL